MSEFLKYFDTLSKKPHNYKQLLKDSNENMNTLKNEFCKSKCNDQNKDKTDCFSICLKKSDEIDLFLDKEISVLKSKRWDVYNFNMEI